MESVQLPVAARGPERASAEADLLRAGIAGDRAALAQLLTAHEPALFAFCLELLRHVDDAEDAVQETFLRALRGLRGFRADAAFRTWLFRIAVNVCLTWRSTRVPTEPWDEERAPVHPISPEALAVRHLRLREALGTLPPRQRAVLLLKSREGWSVAEIAAGLGCSERQVEYELFKARRALVEWRRRDAESNRECDAGEAR